MKLEFDITPVWREKLAGELEKPYFKNVTAFLEQELKNYTVYPPRNLIFNAFNQCHFSEVKVVILGQDPYHGAGQANGLSFSVNDGVKIPPSLRNILREIKNDVGKEIPSTGNLEHWAKQGVLLLNAILTVKANEPASHRNKGWEQFTDAVIRLITEQGENVVFLLWGNYAQQKGEMIDSTKHLILKAAHPSPLSVNRFFGCKHFSQTNAYLKKIGKVPIAW